jgi:hypothetical protein
MTALSSIGATIDYTNASDPELRIKWSAIKNFLNWTNTPIASKQTLDPWLACMFQGLAQWNQQTSTTAHNVVISTPVPGIQSRNNIDNRLTSNYSVTVFSLSPVASTIDADDLYA